MPPVIRPQDLLTMIDDLNRQVRDISTTAQTQYSSVKEGGITILDGDGNPVIFIGKASTSYGITIFTPENRALFSAGRDLSAAPPVTCVMFVGVSALKSTATADRPGTTSGTLTEIWAGDFFSVGPDIFWSVIVAPNAQTMQFQVTIQEDAGTEQVVYNETGITLLGSRSDTFTIPTSCLATGTGTDVLGRFFRLRYYARRSAGATGTVDVGLARHPLNANFV